MREASHVRKKGKKPFAIECRYVGSSVISRIRPSIKEWHLFRRYETAKDRDQAIETLRMKSRNYEYRVGDQSTKTQKG